MTLATSSTNTFTARMMISASLIITSLEVAVVILGTVSFKASRSKLIDVTNVDVKRKGLLTAACQPFDDGDILPARLLLF